MTALNATYSADPDPLFNGTVRLSIGGHVIREFYAIRKPPTNRFDDLDAVIADTIGYELSKALGEM